MRINIVQHKLLKYTFKVKKKKRKENPMDFLLYVSV